MYTGPRGLVFQKIAMIVITAVIFSNLSLIVRFICNEMKRIIHINIAEFNNQSDWRLEYILFYQY
jgi:hypothetical protein